MTTRQQENIKIKQALKKEFPVYKISVRQDHGTASGWKLVKIETNISENGRYGNAKGEWNKEVCEKFSTIEKKAREIVKQNCELYTYCSDDGYNTERDCLLIDVHGIAYCLLIDVHGIA
jgi:hypothetical protein